MAAPTRLGTLTVSGVSKIVCDCALGGGTIKNVRFMPGGSLEVVTADATNPTVLNVLIENPVDAFRSKWT